MVIWLSLTSLPTAKLVYVLSNIFLAVVNFLKTADSSVGKVVSFHAATTSGVMVTQYEEMQIVLTTVFEFNSFVKGY